MTRILLRRLLAPAALLLAAAWAQPNNPYPGAEEGKNIFYYHLDERPKFLDPARAYSHDEYIFICQIYEPPLQYHYLKRPYELVPLTSEGMPVCENFDAEGKALPAGAPAEGVARSVWTVRIKPGMMYQDHPCFAKNGKGESLYRNLGRTEAGGLKSPYDLPRAGTRELLAADYVYQMKRMADPRIRCPIFSSVLSEYVLGMKEYAARLDAELKGIRDARAAEAAGRGELFFDREDDEKRRPVILDYAKFDCPGLSVLSPTAFQVTLLRSYQQFRYWLAMPFFAPMPEEAVRFYGQGPLVERNLTLDWYPVGTGAFFLAENRENFRIVLRKNGNFRGEQYPSEGEAGDAENGLLSDAGRIMPFLDAAVYSWEREVTPMWNKFVQGYYDLSGISSDKFQDVMDFRGGSTRINRELSELGIRLSRSVDTSIFYTGFNMLDPLLGGLDQKRCKLRRALCLAMVQEQFIRIFRNGRGVVAHGPIPPGIFGHRTGREGMNPYLYEWDGSTGAPRRRSLDEAKKLLAEAGYPGGVSEADGKPLTVFYDTVQNQGNAAYREWMKKQFAAVGVGFEMRETDYNRFREKMSSGNFQMFSWGWNADYPDPENFLFLLYGPNGATGHMGENTANYVNPEYDALFVRMASMDNTPERALLIDRMTEIVRRDAPWDFGLFPETYALVHSWTRNYKQNTMANNTLKYRRIEAASRSAYRAGRNRPRSIAIASLFAVVFGVAAPVVFFTVRRELRG